MTLYRAHHLTISGIAGAILLLALACTAPAPASPGPGAASPAAAVTTAPAKPTPPAATVATKTTVPTGRVTLVYDPMPHRFLNPALTTAPANGLWFMFPMYDGLTWIDREGRLQKGLATEWRVVNERTWEFRLGDYRFHNGDPVTAQDVADTFNWIRDPANQLASITFLATVASVETPDARTVRVMTSGPDPALAKALSMVMVLPVKRLNEQGRDRFFANPTGSGPFKPTRIDLPNSIEYTAVGAEWVTPRGVPNVRDLTIRFASEAGVKSAALKTNEADIAAPLPADVARGLERDGFKLDTFPANGALHFLLDPNDGPTRDVRVRRAINHAVDKEAIVRSLLGGFAEADTQLIGPGVTGFNRTLRPYPYDVARARALMAEAGFASGFRTEITVTTSPIASKEIGEAILGYLQPIGIGGDVRVREFAEVFPAILGPQHLRKGIFYGVFNFDLFEPTPWRFFSTELPVERGRRWNEPEVTEFDRFYLTAKREFDDARRDVLYQQAAAYLYEQAPVLFLWRYFSPAAWNPKVTWKPSQLADSWTSQLSKAP